MNSAPEIDFRTHDLIAISSRKRKALKLKHMLTASGSRYPNLCIAPVSETDGVERAQVIVAYIQRKAPHWLIKPLQRLIPIFIYRLQRQTDC